MRVGNLKGGLLRGGTAASVLIAVLAAALRGFEGQFSLHLPRWPPDLKCKTLLPCPEHLEFVDSHQRKVSLLAESVLRGTTCPLMY